MQAARQKDGPPYPHCGRQSCRRPKSAVPKHPQTLPSPVLRSMVVQEFSSKGTIGYKPMPPSILKSHLPSLKCQLTSLRFSYLLFQGLRTESLPLFISELQVRRFRICLQTPFLVYWPSTEQACLSAFKARSGTVHSDLPPVLCLY